MSDYLFIPEELCYLDESENEQEGSHKIYRGKYHKELTPERWAEIQEYFRKSEEETKKAWKRAKGEE